MDEAGMVFMAGSLRKDCIEARDELQTILAIGKAET